MIWKYGHCLAGCNCKGDNLHNRPIINFTTLVPMDNKTNKEDYDLIDKIGNKLRNFGFEFKLGTVMLASHFNYTIEEIKTILKDENIIIK